jgi:hypothetical protein
VAGKIEVPWLPTPHWEMGASNNTSEG